MQKRILNFCAKKIRTHGMKIQTFIFFDFSILARKIKNTIHLWKFKWIRFEYLVIFGTKIQTFYLY